MTKKNRNKYIIPIQIFKLEIKIKDKQIEIENLENKIQQLKERDV